MLEHSTRCEWNVAEVYWTCNTSCSVLFEAARVCPESSRARLLVQQQSLNSLKYVGLVSSAWQGSCSGIRGSGREKAALFKKSGPAALLSISAFDGQDYHSGMRGSDTWRTAVHQSSPPFIRAGGRKRKRKRRQEAGGGRLINLSPVPKSRASISDVPLSAADTRRSNFLTFNFWPSPPLRMNSTAPPTSSDVVSRQTSERSSEKFTLINCWCDKG